VKRSLALVVLALSLWIVAPASGAAPHVSASQRKAINHTIDLLVNHAVKRHDPAAAYNVVTPTLRADMTRKEWASGSIPIYPYPARGTAFHGWTIKYVTPGEVAVELMLQPRQGEKVGPILFDIYLDPVGGKWLVDSFMPVATFAPLNAKKPKVRALNDFMPRQGTNLFTAPNGRGRVSSVVAYVPFAVIGLVLLGLIGTLVVGGLRYRPRAGGLPPFPGSRRAR
jgi:hypothetical protein